MEITFAESFQILKKWQRESAIVDACLIIPGTPSIDNPHIPDAKILSRVIGTIGISENVDGMITVCQEAGDDRMHLISSTPGSDISIRERTQKTESIRTQDTCVGW